MYGVKAVVNTLPHKATTRCKTHFNVEFQHNNHKLLNSCVLEDYMYLANRKQWVGLELRSRRISNVITCKCMNNPFQFNSDSLVPFSKCTIPYDLRCAELLYCYGNFSRCIDKVSDKLVWRNFFLFFTSGGHKILISSYTIFKCWNPSHYIMSTTFYQELLRHIFR